MFLCENCCPNPHPIKSFGHCERCGLKHQECGDCHCPPKETGSPKNPTNTTRSGYAPILGMDVVSYERRR